MSDGVDIIEHMFEYEGMQAATALRTVPAAPDSDGPRGSGRAGTDHLAEARAALDRITTLRSRIADMEDVRVDTTGLPTADVLAPLLPGGAIRPGGTYAVHDSVLLATTMLQAASASGAWCAVVGVPSFGVESAEALGIDLERLVLVPDPGDQWLGVTAALADVASIVLTRPLGRVAPGDVSRLSARLRQRGAALVSLGSWPGADASLRVTGATWSGIGAGHGYLAERRATVTVNGRAGAVRPTSAELLLPAADGTVRAASVAGGAAAAPSRPGGRVLRPVAVAS
jgi:hypothetical protein